MSAIPFGRHRATLLRRERARDGQGRPLERWQPMRVVGCSIYLTLCDREAGTHTAVRPAARCHIPANQPEPRPGDAILPGVVLEGGPFGPGEAAALIADTPGAFRVTRVEDRCGPGWPLPHWVAEGE